MAVPHRAENIGNGCTLPSLINPSWESTVRWVSGEGRCSNEFSYSDIFSTGVCSSSLEIPKKPNNIFVEQTSWNEADVAVHSTPGIITIDNSNYGVLKEISEDHHPFCNTTSCVQSCDRYHGIFAGTCYKDGSPEATSESRKRTIETCDVRSPEIGKRANNMVRAMSNGYDIHSTATLSMNGTSKTRGRRGLAKDPQSVAARLRRKRINTRLKTLRDLITDGSKMDLVTMLEKAIMYVKCLQLQVKILTNDDYWFSQEEISEQSQGVAALPMEQLTRLPDV